MLRRIFRGACSFSEHEAGKSGLANSRQGFKFSTSPTKSWANSIRIDDVVRLKQLEDYKIFHIQGKEFTINSRQLLGEFTSEILEKSNQEIYSLEVFDKNHVPYHISSPMSVIAQESFYIRLNNHENFLVLNFRDDQIIDAPYNNQEESEIRNILSSLGSTDLKKDILSNFVTEISNELLKVQDANGNVSIGTLATIIRLKIQKDTHVSSSNIFLSNKILHCLYQKRDKLNLLKTERLAALKKSSDRRLKALYSLIALQMAFTQWGTYVQYSWDIMEPIANIFGIVDLILAYSYWMLKNNDFDFKTFQDNYLNQRVSQQLGKEINFSEEMEDIEDMIGHIKIFEKINSSSDDMSRRMEGLDAKFQPLE